jgi:hypothetical protein
MSEIKINDQVRLNFQTKKRVVLGGPIITTVV